MTRIAIIIGSTRPGCRGRIVAEWAHASVIGHPAVTGGAATVDLIDLADHDLPLLDEPVAAMFGRYRNAHSQQWAATIARYDAFVFVTAEYNQSIPAALKNAIDYLFAEWNGKTAGFVSYGVQGGVRAVEHLRIVLAALKVDVTSTHVALSLTYDFEPRDPTSPDAPHVLAAPERHEPALTAMLDEIISRSDVPVSSPPG